ncbi:membrane-bound PQQ-dependent dehydrogenase, glucose/quinate/shikimate family [Paraburkholderia caballeronis]|uniref:Quinoprotein glucose dehydrogenase n=1 Tax=Paraburkholderia caballeronis TaxID=416943 RepID=A0A1H7GCA7_9BURK|nr:membrane-bound PQQ-dependent dehydrogenase, glucose/quinate/shikimate family [Paraburkholderia caballeronis]PXW24697.1 quinoprotein glucose dehydrogenase [Paraburkholderia caballeronis]PXX00427.1 quinoprotein glucose dehydrogenase [Paraburkholderia caballeronis]RAJ98490.1 quinoprotein glucose dehydrogenase [Paraburkholderia caballeronis]SEE64999.1 quinoprotein glucose dehydrogenase [Paraburkholderia caballeronis]SEK33465.1 quinoprotein glucose dehydrogenase [Paraburkholderia caballeronis]
MDTAARVFACLLALVSLGLTGAGAWLVALGGSPYYALAGVAYAGATVLIWRRSPAGAHLVGLVALVTVPWALWESGIDFWGLFSRLLTPMALAALAWLCSPAPRGTPARRLALALGGGALLLCVAGFGLAFAPHDVIRPDARQQAAYRPAAGDNHPSDWTAYGRTTAGLRYAPFDQINRGNVGRLGLAWVYRTHNHNLGVDQNTPLQIGNTLYSCNSSNVVAALDVDSGHARWVFDPNAKSPFWQRCRGLGYYKAASAARTEGLCAERVIETTIDARLIAIDARTGQLCPDFGDHGIVQLSQGMGPIKPGFYFQTSAPLVARDKIVVGGWVLDDEEVGEPSGVIRAFNVLTGQLEWAWDLGNPAITRLPPAGQTYTRGTPNMWTTAAYDDRLGLVYAPLGNMTPDYFGATRPAYADAYNSSLVALDIDTGREQWKFQTVHHDLWDYDLPSQPALIDVPDGHGRIVPAVLQTTKRGQIFLLDRATGTPLADVQEKPVPQTGGVPEERLARTQPYSVGMPTIGAQPLTEKRMWGVTMFDQLACRILFRRARYAGDFTPVGLTPAIQQPGNLGGFNWGSVSVDVANRRVFMNDVRVPSVFWLIPRKDYPRLSAKIAGDGAGHGPSPQSGTPYGLAAELWMSPAGIPCAQPPFGTITAIDMNTRQVAWQVPAGTAEQLGPFRIKLHLPLTTGAPTYAGTSATAGGLVFFAGSQDYYLRAYDEATGDELWKYPLPVGASATPMTYVSPVSQRQYVVVSVGGAAHSRDQGDYLMAFALN